MVRVGTVNAATVPLLVSVVRMLQRRRADSVPQAAQDLHEVFVRRARELNCPV
ncbi:hypothetical protein GCM10009864_60200 [Streptomyces lunalinharesii]|uniref:Uncharacterized protein n=1 Tax=Streptomyces lunalinharesii TaxID=333384 RepID=A0ABN3SLA1_9ACTN